MIAGILVLLTVVWIASGFCFLGVVWIALGESDVNGDPERDAGYSDDELSDLRRSWDGPEVGTVRTPRTKTTAKQ